MICTLCGRSIKCHEKKRKYKYFSLGTVQVCTSTQNHENQTFCCCSVIERVAFPQPAATMSTLLQNVQYHSIKHKYSHVRCDTSVNVRFHNKNCQTVFVQRHLCSHEKQMKLLVNLWEVWNVWTGSSSSEPHLSESLSPLLHLFGPVLLEASLCPGSEQVQVSGSVRTLKILTAAKRGSTQNWILVQSFISTTENLWTTDNEGEQTRKGSTRTFLIAGLC